MTIDDLIRQAEDTLRQRNDRLADMQATIAQGTAERSTQPQRVAAEKITTEHVRAAIADRDRAADDLTRLRAEKADDDAADRAAHTITRTAPGRQETAVYTVNEATTYSREAAEAGHHTFLGDLYRAQLRQDPAAAERLARHGREVETRGQMSARAVVTSGVAGFVPPPYLSDMFAEYARAGRPVANLVTSLPLPAQGMTVNLPRITTGSTTAAQTVEGTSISTTDLDDTLLQVPVVTIAGYVDVSRQAIERGELVEAVVLADLAASYNSELDRQVLNGAGSGEHVGIRGTANVNTVTFTDNTDPTFAELYPKLADAIGQIQSQRFTGPTAIVMHPRRWAWANAALSTSFPLIGQSGGTVTAAGTSEAPGYGGPVGRLMGVPVYTDGNVLTNLGAGTNQDEIYVLDARDSFLFEDPNASPAQLRFDSIGSATLTVRLSAYGFSAFTAGRQPKAVSIISGTGLTSPSL